MGIAHRLRLRLTGITTAATLSGAVALLVLLIPAVAQADRVRTTVTLDGYIEPALAWFGEVRSPATKCKRDRKVLLFKEIRNGPDRLLESARTEREYFPFYTDGEWVWRIEEAGPRSGGSYYARAQSTHDCRADLSPVWEPPSLNGRHPWAE